MLKIIMGSELVYNFIDKKQFVEFPNGYFDSIKKEAWFNDKLVREIIEQVDRAYVELGFSVRSIDYSTGYSVNDLSGGSKFLILAHMLRDKVYLATMGDNCTDLLEKIAMEYEKEGKDLIIVSNYLHRFNFKYVKEIEYLNWGIRCKSWKEIYNKVYDRWEKQEKEF